MGSASGHRLATHEIPSVGRLGTTGIALTFRKLSHLFYSAGGLCIRWLMRAYVGGLDASYRPTPLDYVACMACKRTIKFSNFFLTDFENREQNVSVGSLELVINL